MIHINFSEEDNILYVKFEGSINLNDILGYIELIITNNNLPRKLAILEDITAANFSFTAHEIFMVSKEIGKSIENYELVRVAAVYSSPRETAMGLLLERHSNYSNYQYKIFSTTAGAIDWLTI